MDPNIWSRKGPLQAMLFPKDEETTPALIESLAPTQVLSSEFNGTIPETEEFQNLHRVAKIFENSGKEIIWIAPPVSKQAVPGNHKPIYTQYYAALAQEFDQDFYNYAGIGFDEELLRDATHLNATGRSLFSKVIAHHLAHHFEKD